MCCRAVEALGAGNGAPVELDLEGEKRRSRTPFCATFARSCWRKKKTERFYPAFRSKPRSCTRKERTPPRAAKFFVACLRSASLGSLCASVDTRGPRGSTRAEPHTNPKERNTPLALPNPLLFMVRRGPRALEEGDECVAEADQGRRARTQKARAPIVS